MSLDVPIVRCDNISATYIASNLVFPSRTKHIELDDHFIRDWLARKMLFIRLVSTKELIGDILMNGFPRTIHSHLLPKLTDCSTPPGLPRSIKPSKSGFESNNIDKANLLQISFNNPPPVSITT